MLICSLKSGLNASKSEKGILSSVSHYCQAGQLAKHSHGTKRTEAHLDLLTNLPWLQHNRTAFLTQQQSGLLLQTDTVDPH